MLNNLISIFADFFLKILSHFRETAMPFWSRRNILWRHSLPSWQTSFRGGVCPSALKQGRVTLLLKKPGLDQSNISNFRPITIPYLHFPRYAIGWFFVVCNVT